MNGWCRGPILLRDEDGKEGGMGTRKGKGERRG